MKIPGVLWCSSIEVVIVFVCGIIAFVSQSSVSVGVENLHIKTQIKL